MMRGSPPVVALSHVLPAPLSQCFGVSLPVSGVAAVWRNARGQFVLGQGGAQAGTAILPCG